MKKIRTIAIVLSTVLAGSAEGQEIRLFPAAVCTDETVRLGQVASLTALDPATATIVVLSLPEAGTSGRLTVAEVQNALRQAGVNPVPIAFSGAAHCAVRRVANARPPAPGPGGDPPAAAPPPEPTATPPANKVTLGQAVLKQLANELGAPTEAITVTFDGSSARTAAMTPTGEIAITSTNRNRLGRRRWRADFSIKGRKLRRYLSARVALRRELAVAKRALLVGEVVGPDDVELVRRDDNGSATVMTDLAAVVGQQVRRAVRLGEPIRPENLTAPVLVKRGQTAWVRCGPVRLPAKALSKGIKGDRVEFENPRSNRRFWAVITGPGTAEMALTPALPQQESKG